MLNFYAKSYTKYLTALVQFEIALEKAPESNPGQALGQAVTQFKELGAILGEAGFAHIKQRTERVFKEWQQGRLTRDNALFAIRELREDLPADLAQHLYFVVPASDRAYYEKPLLPPATAAAFSAADEELQLAGKCLVLGQHSASVYHAMRALESGLNAFTFQLQVPPSDRATWGQSIDQIEKAIKSARDQKLTPEQRVLLDSYSEAATHFRLLKDAWRNHAMHKRQNYDRDKAEDILRHVSQFVEQLAGLGIKEQT